MLNVFAATVSLDQGREGDEVWLDPSVHSIKAVKRVGSALLPHVLKNLGSLVNLSTSHTTVNYGVESDNIWLDLILTLWRYHDVVNI